MFTWTSEHEAECPPVRGHATPATPTPLDDKKLATAIKTTHAALAEKILANTATRADEADAFLVASIAKSDKLTPAIVDRWFARFGAAGAVETAALVARGEPVVLMQPTRAALLVRMRRRLAQASDYDAAVDYVRTNDGIPTWFGMSATHRYPIAREVNAYLFPDHRPFFDDAVDFLIAQDHTTSYLLGAVASAADVDRIGARRIGYGDWNRNALVVARACRDAGLAHLVAYTARSNQLAGVARALTAYVSPEAAAALALYLETKLALPILRAYFTAHPTLAHAALEPIAKTGKKKPRELATEILASL